LAGHGVESVIPAEVVSWKKRGDSVG
jgi:hypothetical protein